MAAFKGSIGAMDDLVIADTDISMPPLLEATEALVENLAKLVLVSLLRKGEVKYQLGSSDRAWLVEKIVSYWQVNMQRANAPVVQTFLRSVRDLGINIMRADVDSSLAASNDWQSMFTITFERVGGLYVQTETFEATTANLNRLLQETYGFSARAAEKIICNVRNVSTTPRELVDVIKLSGVLISDEEGLLSLLSKDGPLWLAALTSTFRVCRKQGVEFSVDIHQQSSVNTVLTYLCENMGLPQSVGDAFKQAVNIVGIPVPKTDEALELP
jgi:hypothetical protein